MTTTLHPEEVKAAIRIRHGTMKRFATAAGLKEDAIRDYLRGRSSTAHGAIAKLLNLPPKHLALHRPVPIRGLNSADRGVPHVAATEVEA